MHLSLCICDQIPRLVVRTRLRLIIHRRETLRTTNTGALAARCLVGSEALVYDPAVSSLVPPFDPGGPLLVLFPSDTAEPVSARHAGATLYVPDGSWRQAKRMRKKMPWLGELQHVCLPPGGAPSTYRLRAPRNADDLATAEAIARAMGILEGAGVQQAIERVFRMMVDRTMFSRGLLSPDRVFGGIPPGVMPHDPTPPVRAVRENR